MISFASQLTIFALKVVGIVSQNHLFLQATIILIPLLLLFMFYSRALRIIMFIVARRFQNSRPEIKYIAVKIAKSNFGLTVLALVFLVANIVLVQNKIDHKMIEMTSKLLGWLVILRSLAIISSKNKSSIMIVAIAFVIAIDGTAIKNKIQSALETIKFVIVEVNVSLYMMTRAVFMAAVLFWFMSIILSFGRKFLYFKAYSNQNSAEREHDFELQNKIFSYCVYFAVVIIFLTIFGVKSNHIALIGSAIGVGVGFGLQRVAADLVSGVILLMEKNIKVGDILELDEGQIGTIKAFGVRSMVITSFDGKDFIVPNEKFTSQKAINYTLSNNRIRISCTFHIVDKKDVKTSLELMRRACLSQKEVFKKDNIVCCVRDVTERGIQLISIIWVKDFAVDDVIKIKSGIYLATLELFKENKIDLYLDRSLGLFKDTINAVTTTIDSTSSTPIANQFENSPLTKPAPRDTSFKNGNYNPTKYSDMADSGWKKRT